MLSLSPTNFDVPEELKGLHLAGGEMDAEAVLNCLMMCPKRVLLVLSYVVLASIRSVLLANGVNLQAVLYIVGPKGQGKTTLAKRVAGIYRDDSGRTAGFAEAASTDAAIYEAGGLMRDAPLVVDDLCLSSSKAVERKRMDLLSSLVRFGAGDGSRKKKEGKTTVSQYCEAGLIFTAEFGFQSQSDLDRCLLVPIKRLKELPYALNTDLVGSIVRAYSKWFLENWEDELQHFRSAVLELKNERRAKNYGVLLEAWKSLARMLRSIVGKDSRLDKLDDKVARGIQKAIESHEEFERKILERIPIGNLAHVLLEAIKDGAFNLAEKKKAVNKCDGIIRTKETGDYLWVKGEALLRVVNLQRGFQDWTVNRIGKELIMYAALTIQEENGRTVKLKKNGPRGYEIDLGRLNECAEKY